MNALSGGQSRISFETPCRANQTVAVEYSGVKFVRKIAANGAFSFILDCFAGDAPQITLSFADGAVVSRAVAARDLDTVSKIAVIWRGAVNLDLHVFEYAADHDQPGHIWAKNPGSPLDSMRQVAVEGKARGFLSTSSDGAPAGDNIEVYTLWNAKNQRGGAIATTLDYESRARLTPDPESCGSGLFADLEYEVVMWSQKNVTRSKGAFSALPCGQKLTGQSRFLSKAVPDIFFR